ncbi:MAG: hypothetical protein LQ337_007944 [Flavoplaca oasis]|nr:MAG: hypothetical protein LQ337_007944 [Flavoplaca oasis]
MAPSPSIERNRPVATTTIFLIYIVAFASANCFLPNGTDRNSILWDSHGIDYQPSGYGSPADDFQMCCATNNRQNPDTPRKDGLCNDLAGIWRESCTDPTWKSPSCVKLCIDGIDEQGENRRDHDSRITQCPDLSYCCGHKNTTCCTRGDGVWLKDGEPTTINPNSTQSTTSSTTPTNTAAPVVAQPASIPPPTPEHPSISATMIAGIVIGAVGAVIILTLAIFLFLLRRKRRRRSTAKDSDKAPASLYSHQSPTDIKSPQSMSQCPTKEDTKGDLSISILSPNTDADPRSELYGDKGQLTPRAELAGEDRAGQGKDGEAVELVGCMPTRRELE